MTSAVLILDFGSQFTQLIARRVRELGVYSEIRPCDVTWDKNEAAKFQALILSGGPASVNDSCAPKFDKRWLENGLPILGICYGQQLIAALLGARLEQGQSREFGKAELEVLDNSSLFYNFKAGERSQVWMSHGDHVSQLPPGCKLLARSSGSPIAAFAHVSLKLYAIQFHPEVVHTLRGRQVLENFLLRIAQLKTDWTPAGFIETAVGKIREAVASDAHVICALSGGVDSSVAAALVNQALSSRLTCIFVDNGLLREGEVDEVTAALGKSGLGLNLMVVDARERFLGQLKGIIDPEMKRKIIGRVFIEVFDEEAKKILRVTHLVQGTLYPDVIESVSVRGPSATIKTHHNVGGLPEKMHLKLIEPLRELFKDEVRLIGKDLQVPDSILKRQPFPGPGLAVRCLGEINETRLELLRRADAIINFEIKNAGLSEKLWQSFAVLLPVKSVGVMGDGRTYESSVVLRAVVSEDGMTADWYYLPEDLLRRISNRITNEVKGINRVVLDISSKPPATIEWE